MWKQIIRESLYQKKDVILVINDVKDDWWSEYNKSTGGIPRLELIKEMFDSTNKKFWMYDADTFLHNSKKYLATSLTEETINEVKDVKTASQNNYSEVITNWIFHYFKSPFVVPTMTTINTDHEYIDFLDYEVHTSQFRKIGIECKKQMNPSDIELINFTVDLMNRRTKLKNRFGLNQITLLYEAENFDVSAKFLNRIKSHSNFLNLLQHQTADFQLIIIYIKENSVHVVFDSYDDFNYITLLK